MPAKSRLPVARPSRGLLRNTILCLCAMVLGTPGGLAGEAEKKQQAAEARAKQLEAVRLLMLERARELAEVKERAARLRAKGFLVRPGRTIAPTQTPVSHAHVAPVLWRIPAGKFGLKLSDGTRIIGTPPPGWTASVKTGFGVVSIPLAQILRVEPRGADGVAVHLKNGDRVSGVLAASKMRFATEFGVLSIPSSDLRLLSSADVSLGTPSSGTSATPKPVRHPPRPRIGESLPDG